MKSRTQPVIPNHNKKATRRDMRRSNACHPFIILSTMVAIAAMTLLLNGCAIMRHQRGQEVQVARIRDDAFRQYLLEQQYVKPYRGTMRPYGIFVPRSEMVEVTEAGKELRIMNCHRRQIGSLEGLVLFPKLEELVCSENPIETLELDVCRNLREVIALEVPLQRLDISHNSQLRLLNISHNRLRYLNLAGNPQLEELLCIFSPNIKELDMTHNAKLKKLYIRGTSIPIIDLRRNPNIQDIYASDCLLQYLIVAPSHDLDKIRADAGTEVQLLVLDSTAPLPQADTTATLPMEKRISNTPAKVRQPMVLEVQQTAAAGIDEKELRRQYRPAFTYNTESNAYDTSGIVYDDKQCSQFLLTFQLFLQGIADEMTRQGYYFDREYEGHCRVYFSADGYAEYFIFNFLGEETPTSEQQRQMRQVLEKHLVETPIAYGSWRPFSQCGSIVFKCKDKPQPPIVVEEDDRQ